MNTYTIIAYVVPAWAHLVETVAGLGTIPPMRSSGCRTTRGETTALDTGNGNRRRGAGHGGIHSGGRSGGGLGALLSGRFLKRPLADLLAIFCR